MDKAVLLRLRDYFRKDWNFDRRERGCLLSTMGNIVPFDNISSSPVDTIVMGSGGFMAMCDLVADHTFDCWCHSHPIWPARPSWWDVVNHKMPTDMLIYSCMDDVFARYTVTEIIEIEKQMKQGTYSFYKNREILQQGDITNGKRINIRTENSCDRSRRHRKLVLP
jgi:proteasome lid subunit RPN8/RPN11